MYLNCILNLFVKTFLNYLNEIKESITLSCLFNGLYCSDRLDTDMMFGARQKSDRWRLSMRLSYKHHSFSQCQLICFQVLLLGNSPKGSGAPVMYPSGDALFSLWNSPVSLGRCGSVTGDAACRWQTVGVWTTLTVVSFSPHRLCLFRKLIQ